MDDTRVAATFRLREEAEAELAKAAMEWNNIQDQQKDLRDKEVAARTKWERAYNLKKFRDEQYIHSLYTNG